MVQPVSEELVARATFEHQLFREDSKKVLQFLMKPSMEQHILTPFLNHESTMMVQVLSLLSHHNMMEALISGGSQATKDKAPVNDMRDSSWKGAGTITISSFINKHQATFDDLECCSGAHLQAVEFPSKRWTEERAARM